MNPVEQATHRTNQPPQHFQAIADDTNGISQLIHQTNQISYQQNQEYSQYTGSSSTFSSQAATNYQVEGSYVTAQNIHVPQYMNSATPASTMHNVQAGAYAQARPDNPGNHVNFAKPISTEAYQPVNLTFMSSSETPNSPIFLQPSSPPILNRIVDDQGFVQTPHENAAKDEKQNPSYTTRPQSSPYEEIPFEDIDFHDSTSAACTEYLTSYAIMNSKDIAAQSPLPLGVLLSPCVNLHPPATTLRRPSAMCAECGARSNLYCTVKHSNSTNDNDQWTCCFCQCQNIFPDGGDSYGLTGLDRPELTKKVYQYTQAREDFLETSSANAYLDNAGPDHDNFQSRGLADSLGFSSTNGSIPRDSSAPCSDGETYIFVVDANVPQTVMEALRSSIGSCLKEFPENAKVGLIAFSSTVALYDVTQMALASANVISGTKSPGPDDLEYLLGGNHLGPVDECADTLLDCLQALESGCAIDEADSALVHARCMGAAIEVALTILEGSLHKQRAHIEANGKDGPSASEYAQSFPPTSHYGGGHVIVCTAGAPNLGPGSTSDDDDNNKSAAEYYRKLALRAKHNGTHVHCFMVGDSSFCVKVIRNAVAPTGGSMFIYRTFGEQFRKDIQLTLFRSIGFNGILEIHSNNALVVTRVIGAVSEEVRHEDEQAQDAERKRNRTHRVPGHKTEPTNSLRFYLSSVRPDLAIAVYFELQDDIPDDYAYVQFVLTYTNFERQQVTRVITRRLRTTGNWTTFVRSIDVKVVAIMMAKRSVLMATEEPIEEVYKDLDEQVSELILRFTYVPSGSKPPQRHLLPEIAPLPLILFNFRRGPLLSSILQHSDDIYALRMLFLSSNRTDSLRLLSPSLLSFNFMTQDEVFEELPMQTLAMHSQRILYLDHHTHILIWSGSKVTGPECDCYRDACLQRASQSSATRLPQPDILMFDEGSSAERWLRCRLIPTHKDPPEVYLAHFPQLQSLSQQEQQELVQKFFPTDDLTFNQYFQTIFGKTQF